MNHFHTTAVLLALGLSAGGCASVTTTTPNGDKIVRSQDEFRAYVEQVFRLQNSVGDELISRYDMNPAAEASKDETLIAAEERMQQSCRLVNDVVASHMDGNGPSLRMRLQLVDSVAACDHAAQEVARLIGYSAPAGGYLTAAP